MKRLYKSKWMSALVISLLLTGVVLARSPQATGGQLYDKWWAVTGAPAPAVNQPLWARQSTNARTGADTWRCTECHGWDYRGAEGAYGPGSSHYTGFPGILKAVQSQGVEDLLADLKGRTDPDHNFSGVMNEAQLQTLAEFLKNTLTDPARYVAEDGTILGDSDHGEVLFSRVCAACHGEDGRAFNFATLQAPEYLGTLAKVDPWKVFHKVRYGQPGTDMPSGVDAGWSTKDAADVLAFMLTLPGEKGDAQLALGAALYDNWPVALGVDAPDGTAPLYPANGQKTGADTWRCKECHGWDYRGASGAYGSGSHYTGIMGVMAMDGRPVEQALQWLDGSRNPQHDFGSYLNEDAQLALARFLTEGLVDTSAYIGEDGKSLGDPLRGHNLFTATCAYCHGMDGTAFNFKDGDHPEYVSTIARENPWELFHKVRAGQPGTEMPAGLARGWETQFAADVLAYAQTLPTAPLGDAPAKGGALYDNWFAVLGVAPPEGDMPLWARQSTNTRSGPDTWRCVECHGWDYKGKDGAYNAASSHFTGFPGLMNAMHTLSVEELVGVLQGQQDPAHDFSGVMNEEALTNLALFIKYAHVNDDDFIDDMTMQTVGGDLQHGELLFQQVCAECHGVDGTLLEFRDEGYPEIIGTVADDDPWEFLHKARFGTPGTEMPLGFLLGWSPQDARDILRYAQTLPNGREENPQGQTVTEVAPAPTLPPGGPANSLLSGVGTAIAAFGAAVGVNLIIIGGFVLLVFVLVWVWRKQS